MLLRMLGTRMLTSEPGGLTCFPENLPSFTFPKLLWVTGQPIGPRRFKAFNVEYLDRRIARKVDCSPINERAMHALIFDRDICSFVLTSAWSE